ncbi:MAG: histidine kinase N-terminal 7TM domain-containing protein, partial [Draconibacterium sp.]|nr:histidine kinase N-terminal 7TM domain-containing protein [Draconibacterium sp.]
MIYQFTSQSFIQFGTALAALLTVMILWQYRRINAVKYLMLLEFMVAIWATTYAFEFGTSKLETKIFWSKLSYLGIAFLPMFYFLFTTAFSQKNKILTNRNIILLSIVPTITLLLVPFTESHRLIWTEVTLHPTENMALYSHG